MKTKKKPGPPEKDIRERFWPNVQKSNGNDCWVWTKSKNNHGYGKIKVKGQVVGTHRVSWELHHGPIPDDLWVLHRCDNPPCVRPDHLFLGTRLDNINDAVQKGRHKTAHLKQGRKNICSRGHDRSSQHYYKDDSGPNLRN